MKPVYLFFLVAFGFYYKAQEKLGITNSNYSTINSIFLHPTQSVDSKVYTQFNIVGAHVYGFTNSAYLPDFSVWQVRRTGAVPTLTPSGIKLKNFMYLVASLEAPAFVISKRNYGAGFFIRARSYGDVRNVPYQLTDLFLNPNKKRVVAEQGSIDLRNVKASNMTWVEYGANFGYMIKKQRKDIIALAGNLRYLTGINIFYANMSRVKGLYNDTVLDLETVKGKLRFNQPGWNTGKGFGLDLGISYRKMLEPVEYYFANSTQSNCKQVDYKYKISFSLRDLGYVRFKKATSMANVDASAYFSTASRDTSIATRLENDLNITMISGNPIMATLPTNLVASFDWNFENNIYLNGTFVKNIIPTGLVGVQAQDLISICPRFEIKPVEVSLPLTFQRYMYPQLGFAFRVRSFVLGFDNVFPLIVKKNTYGGGVYVNLAFSIFNNQGCKVKTKPVANCAPNLTLGERIKQKMGRKKQNLKKAGWYKKWREKRQRRKN